MSMRSAIELYEDDFFAWTQLQAKELRRFARTRPNLPLDLAHIAEEIADLGKSQRRFLRSWTRRIVEHPAPDRALPRRGASARLDRRDRRTSQRGRTPSDADAASGSEATAPAPVRSRTARLGQEARALRRGRGRRAAAASLSLHSRPGAGGLLAGRAERARPLSMKGAGRARPRPAGPLRERLEVPRRGGHKGANQKH